MPSGLIALLDDVATLTKLAAASVDDIAAAAGKAGTKTAGILIDDAAVTPRYVVGLSPERELPIIAKITVGSLKNKLLFLLPAAILLSVFAGWAIVPLLMIGGAYLAFEATEKIIEVVTGRNHGDELLVVALEPVELEKRQIAGAIRTDFILSAEIMAISLANLGPMSLPMRIAALAVIAIGITVLVYGAVAIIVKLDDIGLHLAARRNGVAQKVGRALVRGVPYIMKILSTIGTAAMLWVGGGILLHGLEELQVMDGIPRIIHDAADAVAAPFGPIAPVVEWIANAIGASIAGAIVGGIIVALMHSLPKRKHEAANAH